MTKISKTLLKQIETALTAAGGARSNVPMYRGMWFFGDLSGDVVPWFVPALDQDYEHPQLSGSVGIVVPAFERWWAAEVTSRVNTGDTAAATFGCLVTNFEPFFDPPHIGGGQAPAAIDQMRRLVQALPNSRKSLIAALKTEEVLGRSVRFFQSPSNTHARAFIEWLVRSWPEARGLTLKPFKVQGIEDVYAGLRIELPARMA